MRIRSLFLLSFLLLLLFCPSIIHSWKKDEFRNCNHTPFCKGARGRKPGSCSLVATDVSVSDSDLVAKLVPKEPDPDHDDQEPVKPLALTLSVYRDGIMRLKIDEDPSLESPKRRFQVPDVIVDRFESKKL